MFRDVTKSYIKLSINSIFSSFCRLSGFSERTLMPFGLCFEKRWIAIDFRYMS